MTNFLLLSDIHLSDRPPANCTESYTDDLFELLEHSVKLAEEHNAVTVWAGDIFHIKGSARNSHGLVQRTIDIVKAYPKELFIVPGNHDLANDRLESISTQPLGTLFKAGAKMLKGWHKEGEPIYGVPWLQRFNDVTVSNALEKYAKHSWSDSRHLVITHAPLYPPGKELPYEYFSTKQWAYHMDNQGSVFYGHVHDPHGVYEVDGVTFCNNGSLSRGALTESHISRDVVATLWSSINGQFSTLPLPYKPAEQVFKLEEAVALKQRKVRLDDFLDSIGYNSIEMTSIDAVIAHIKTLNLEPELEQTISNLLEDVT